ncbi:MAG TPA: DedA family protein [Candidatus Nanopelagicaceae bacterium]|nr:DedA family protein [Candidatus Nanopelagicaceae bacterium]
MNLLNANWIVATLGLVGVLFVLFVETGLLIGLVLPGDSLLFVAGVSASGTATALVGTHLSLPALLIGAPFAAVLGAQVGHYIGAKYGRPFFDRPDGRVFNQRRVVRAEEWLAKYGEGRAIILARFVPVVRTLVNPLAGVLKVPAGRFFRWNLIGGILWTETVALIGFWLGEKLKGSVDRYLLPLVAIIIVISVIPIGLELRAERKRRKQ